jgi:hypothetical protein
MNDHYVTAAQLAELEIRLAGFVKHSLQAATDAALQAAVMAHTPEIIVQPPEPEPTEADDLKARVDALLIENKHLLSENSRLTGLAWDAQKAKSDTQLENNRLRNENEQLVKQHAQDERDIKNARHYLSQLGSREAALRRVAKSAALNIERILADEQVIEDEDKDHDYCDICGND